MVKLSVALVPAAGEHLEIKSGLGRPTAFFTRSVSTAVSVIEMMKPKMVT